MEGLETAQIIALVFPLVLLHISLAVYCIKKIRHEGVANLHAVFWLVLVVGSMVLGPIIFLAVGRRRDVS